MGMLGVQKDLLPILANRLASQLGRDERVGAVWLGGSLGRGEGDELSDVDLVVVAAPGRTEELVGSLEELLGIAGPVALVHDAPQNAPRGGAQLNVLYDTTPLPIYVDWNVWPPVPARPADVTVLFEREPSRLDPNATFGSILEDMGRGPGRVSDEKRLNHFRVFMTPLIAKNAARGMFESVDRMLGYMRLDDTPPTSLDGTIALAHRILEDYGVTESDLAISCIERYLSLVADYREPARADERDRDK